MRSEFTILEPMCAWSLTIVLILSMRALPLALTHLA
jgi:hypothetical protein